MKRILRPRCSSCKRQTRGVMHAVRIVRQSCTRDVLLRCDQRHDVVGNTNVDEWVCLMERATTVGEERL